LEPSESLAEDIKMKKRFAVLLPLTLCAVTAFAADDAVVRWKNVVGVITIPGVNLPVGNINSGATAWSALNGRAHVNLANGNAFFEVERLVINGGNATGTAGPVSAVVGTLVCGAGTTTQANFDTGAVALNAQGDARFSGRLTDVPDACANPLFLIRIAAPAGAAGRWIATGTERFLGE
jgi:hypothetical protein